MGKFFYFLSLSLVIISVSCTNRENVSISEDTEISQILNENNIPFENEGMNNLQNSFENVLVTRSTGTFKRKKYPEYYGGSYIDKDQKTVVVILVGESPQKYEKEFKKRVGNEPVRFEQGKYSYNELLSIMDKFRDFVRNNENKEVIQNVVAWGIYDDRNVFSIELEDCSESRIKEIKEFFGDSDAIIFEQSERYKEISSANPGGNVRFYETGKNASIGYRARSNDDQKTGIVSTGHGINMGNNVYIGNSHLGRARVVKNRDNVDASFTVLENNNITLSNVTNSGITLNPSVKGVSVGSTINVEGALKGRSFARVTQISAETTINGISYYDLIKIDVSGLQEGDSGGILYTTAAFNIIGILKSATSSTAHAVKAGNINTTFRLTTY